MQEASGNLYSLNYCSGRGWNGDDVGATKEWTFIVGEELKTDNKEFAGELIGHSALERAMRAKWGYLLADPKYADKCSSLRCHRQIFLSDKTLDDFGVKYVKHHQQPGELVVMFPASIHQVINRGIMINEAINYCPKALLGEFRWRALAKSE